MPASRTLRAQSLGFSYPSSPPLFDDVTFHLSPGWAGLVGGNGAGKTTLLQLLRGTLHPTSGNVSLTPADAHIGWCPQRVESLQECPELVHFAESLEGRARKLRGQLHLDPAVLTRWDTASPGERKRWQLGAALCGEPDVLLLDEPTNHLDSQAQSLLSGALSEFRGVGVIVSHDRALLDHVTRATVRLHQGTARWWPHPFSASQALWNAEAEAQRDAQRETRRTLEREQRALNEQRRTLAASQRQRSTGARMKHRHDSDARTLGANFRAEMAEQAHAATLRRVERKAEHLRDALGAIQVCDEPGRALFVRFEACPKPTVVQWQGDVTLPDGQVLVPEVSVQLGRAERLWVQGANGRGKSTLLRLLTKHSAVPEARRLELPQELTRDDALNDLERVKALPPEQRGRVLQLVHALGVEPAQLLRTTEPSPGEARKVRLALGLGSHAWLAVLDEPTNHLDLPSIERLEAALCEYPGAMLLVTHDARLGQVVATRSMTL